jgi:hypothetical protein
MTLHPMLHEELPSLSPMSRMRSAYPMSTVEVYVPCHTEKGVTLLKICCHTEN